MRRPLRCGVQTGVIRSRTSVPGVRTPPRRPVFLVRGRRAEVTRQSTTRDGRRDRPPVYRRKDLPIPNVVPDATLPELRLRPMAPRDFKRLSSLDQMSPYPWRGGCPKAGSHRNGVIATSKRRTVGYALFGVSVPTTERRQLTIRV